MHSLVASFRDGLGSCGMRAWEDVRQHGVVLTTDYSGIGSAEISAGLLQARCFQRRIAAAVVIVVVVVLVVAVVVVVVRQVGK